MSTSKAMEMLARRHRLWKVLNILTLPPGGLESQATPLS